MSADIVLYAFAEGDRTVGDGTFFATLTLECLSMDDEQIAHAKEAFAIMLSPIWDVPESRVCVMTKQQYKEWWAGRSRNRP